MSQRLAKTLRNWFVAPTSGVHLDFADGLRGLAILFVVCAHGFYVNPQGNKAFAFVSQTLTTGWIGLPIFFVLSGFLISLPFFRAREQDPRFWYPRGYTLRRALKIVPPFYLVIAVLAVCYWWVADDADAFRRGLAWATGYAHFVFDPKPFNNSFWSLWVEIGFYVLLPLLFLGLRGLKNRQVGWAIFFILLVVPFLSRTFTWPAGGSKNVFNFVMRRFPNSLDNFAWGVLFSSFYVTMAKEPGRWKGLARLGYVGAAVLAVYCLGYAAEELRTNPLQVPTRLNVELTHFVPALCTFLMLFFVFDPRCAGSRFLSLPVLRFLGVVSYEWFLTHQPAQNLVRTWMGSAQGSLGRYLFTIGAPSLLTLGLAVLLYQSFSLPILKWGRGLVGKKDGKTSPKPAAPVSGLVKR